MSESDFKRTTIQIRAARAGDRAAMHELFARYAPRVHTLVRHKLGPTKDAGEVDDIVQDVLVHAFTRIDQFHERSDARFQHWIARLTANLLVDAQRFAKREKRGGGRVQFFADAFATEQEPPVAAARQQTPSQAAQTNEAEEELLAALRKLSDRYQRVIIARDFEGRSFEEISHALGYQRPAPARALYSRARHKLTTLMKGYARTLLTETESESDHGTEPTT